MGSSLMDQVRSTNSQWAVKQTQEGTYAHIQVLALYKQAQQPLSASHAADQLNPCPEPCSWLWKALPGSEHGSQT